MASPFERYQKKLRQGNEAISKSRSNQAKGAILRAFTSADGYKEGSISERTMIDKDGDQWKDYDFLLKHSLTGQEKKVVVRPDTSLKIGSYVTYKSASGDNSTLIIREALLDDSTMPSYKAFVCQDTLKLKGCPYVFPIYGFNSTYSTKGMVDSNQVYIVDSRNKIYVQKNKYTIALYKNHKNYRILLGDEETQYCYFITEMDDISYPGMFIISLKIDEHHPNDGEYAYNKNEIDFSGLIPPQDNGQGGDTEVGLPELSCETYQKLNTKFEVICNKKIKSYELPQGVEFVSLSSDKHTLVLNPTEKGIKTIKIVDVDNNNVTKKIVIKG